MRDVLVVDEAGMIGSRQMERLLGAAQDAGAKVLLVGDPEQLQAIEAGAAFRAIAERVGVAEITIVRRQRQDWQQQATQELATGQTNAALGRYAAAGMVCRAMPGWTRRVRRWWRAGMRRGRRTHRHGRSSWRIGATARATSTPRPGRCVGRPGSWVRGPGAGD